MPVYLSKDLGLFNKHLHAFQKKGQEDGGGGKAVGHACILI